MTHTRDEVIRRTISEFSRLDRLVSGLSAAEWNKPVPRPEGKDPWTVKDALAHVTFFKELVARTARGEPAMPQELKGLTITEQNHLLYKRYHRWTPRKVLEWHRQVQAELVKALKGAPDRWFTRPSRRADWPFDADGHSAVHRVKDIQGALAKPKTKKG